MSDVVEGSRVSLIGFSEGEDIDLSGVPVESGVLASGTEVPGMRIQRFCSPTRKMRACVFVWADPGLEVSNYFDVVLLTGLNASRPGLDEEPAVSVVGDVDPISA